MLCIIISLELTSSGADRLRANRVESSSTSGESTEVCCQALTTRKVHVSLFHWA